jgi:putative peptidoglycan lipid II flippase
MFSSFFKGATVLTVTTFLSYVTGLLRDKMFAHTFGAGRELDIYNASFIIPDLVLTILVSSALSAAFIPLFTSLNTQNQKEDANKLANTVLHSATFVILLFGGTIAIFMPWISGILAPGFNAEEQLTLVHLTRLMLISPLLMAISSSLGAMLVSYKRYLAYGISPVLYNLGIVAGTLTVTWLGIYGLVLGTLFGVLLHFLPRLIAIRKTPFTYHFKINWKDKNFLKMLVLMLPKMIGHPVEQLNFMAFTRIATLLAVGSVSSISFARNFQSVPISMFGIAFALAIYPTLSECAAKSDKEGYVKNLKKAARDILLFTIPSAIALYFLSKFAIGIFLGGGKFTDANIIQTATVLSAFAFSIPTESLVSLLARAFYALKNTLIPVLFSVLNLIISVTFAYYQSKTIGIVAIPYGFFIGSLTEVIALWIVLNWRLKKL